MLRVMTLNIGSLMEPFWDDRRHEVVAQVVAADADVVCLQEVWQEGTDAGTAGWLVAELSQLGHRYYHIFGGYGIGDTVRTNPPFRFGSAVLSRWPIDESNLWALPLAHDAAGAVPAEMSWELLHARTAGLDIFTTHLAPAPHHGIHRRLQVMAIDARIREVHGPFGAQEGATPQEVMPPILAGDFNAEPDSDEIRYVKGLTVIEGRTMFMQDAWAIGGGDGPGYTSDWRTHPLSASLNVHPKRIDYIFVGDPFRRVNNAGRVHSCRLVADVPMTGVQASDHCGLLAEIEWPTRPYQKEPRALVERE